MAYPPARPEPPILTRQLDQLQQQLRDLTNQLKHDIALAVGETVASTVKHFLRRLLDAQEAPPRREMPFRESDYPNPTWPGDSDAWLHDREDEPVSKPTPASAPSQPSFLKQALTTGVQAGLWWLRQQPRRRPFLSTLAVIALAGGVTLLAGPTLGAGLAILGSLAGMILSGSAAQCLGEQLLDFIRF